MRVDLKQGGTRMLKFEVAGFEPADFPVLPSKH